MATGQCFGLRETRHPTNVTRQIFVGHLLRLVHAAVVRGMYVSHAARRGYRLPNAFLSASSTLLSSAVPLSWKNSLDGAPMLGCTKRQTDKCYIIGAERFRATNAVKALY